MTDIAEMNYIIKEIAESKEISISNAIIQCWSKEHGINAYELPKINAYVPPEINVRVPSRSGHDFIKPSKEELYNMYWDDMMSMPEIAELCDTNPWKIWNLMREYGIKTRTISESVEGRTGEKSGGWRGGISGGNYCYKFNNIFKKAVRERDDYTCQLCGYEQKLDDKNLSVHHIHYDKKNCHPDVVALCSTCNSKVNGNRDYWEKHFEDDLIARGLYCWRLSQET